MTLEAETQKGNYVHMRSPANACDLIDEILSVPFGQTQEFDCHKSSIGEVSFVNGTKTSLAEFHPERAGHSLDTQVAESFRSDASIIFYENSQYLERSCQRVC